ncbi:membrane-bound lytic murein transglycosylase MltC [Candidatus Williamhamiltonella defendens]|uniref:membrane-bound lytic murein transglycosylase MltC n=1 Tax=Candidatus Williamhamiltonella defendens TaxID=138072 RepID=UPI00130DD8B4|nr:membrane-bound lytic murein transglycosylase MltC [Candidatus Hamiltonella defensa]
MKKIAILFLLIFLLISCAKKKNQDNHVDYIKDTDSFDILMGQFAHNIENIWGFNEILMAGPQDYVKYTDQYQTRSHINFKVGSITVETIATIDPKSHLGNAMIATLLMGDDPTSVDLYSDLNDITISQHPFLYGQVLDNHHQPIRSQWAARHFADYLLKTKIQKRRSGIDWIWSITLKMVPNHIDQRAKKYWSFIKHASAKYGIETSLILAIMQTESSFNPYAVSSCDALGLMQVMRYTAGKDVFQMKGKSGQPSRSYLFNPKNNIDIGTAYLSILKKSYLREIKNPISRRYAIISGYNGGAGSVLRAFSTDKNKAIEVINRMQSDDVFYILSTRHPVSEARRYLLKVNCLQKKYRYKE